MGIWPWQCTPTGLDNSTELRMEKIRQAVTEIWVPQVWQPPAQPPARTVTTIPLQPGGLRGKKGCGKGFEPGAPGPHSQADWRMPSRKPTKSAIQRQAENSDSPMLWWASIQLNYRHCQSLVTPSYCDDIPICCFIYMHIYTLSIYNIVYTLAKITLIFCWRQMLAIIISPLLFLLMLNSKSIPLQWTNTLN